MRYAYVRHRFHVGCKESGQVLLQESGALRRDLSKEQRFVEMQTPNPDNYHVKYVRDIRNSNVIQSVRVDGNRINFFTNDLKQPFGFAEFNPASNSFIYCPSPADE